ncbi:MAG: polyprenyl synthetase family protein [Halarsenatibacteraceae bacterium]
MVDIKKVLKEEARDIDNLLNELLKNKKIVPALQESMEYSLLSGGKRVRPILTLLTARLLNGDERAARLAGSALELIHTYSLIHDDLPAMDDDDLRRGKPTNHLVYGEGMAILAGDGLLTYAFNILTDLDLDAVKKCELVKLMAESAGPNGMVAGQVLDLKAENESVNLEDLKKIHRAKTGALFNAAVLAGVYCSEYTNKELNALEIYAEQLGLTFQITDDILDVTGDTELLGKEVGQDNERGKSTYPALIGLEESKKEAEMAVNKGLEALDIFDEDADILRELLKFILERQY